MSEDCKTTLKNYFSGLPRNKLAGKECCHNCKYINRTASGELLVTLESTVCCNKRSEYKELAILNLDSCCDFDFFSG